MIQAIEAVVDQEGRVRLLEPVHLPASQRALVLLLDDGAQGQETAQLSESALAQDWDRPEEDAAWSHLQPGR